jgi:hypothetical protein
MYTCKEAVAENAERDEGTSHEKGREHLNL